MRLGQYKKRIFGTVQVLREAFEIDNLLKLNPLIKSLREDVNDLKDDRDLAKTILQDHEIRIRALESTST